MEMTDVYMRRTGERNGWVTFFAADADGNALHTEPVCQVYVGDVGHKWFAEWLEGQVMPIQMPALLKGEEDD